jgi:hypothetical protein
MLSRIKKSNDILKLHSVKQVNILEIDNSFKVLSELLGVIETSGTQFNTVG